MDDHVNGPPRGWTRRSVLKTIGVAGAGVAGLSVTPNGLTESVAAQTAPPFSTEDVTVESFDGTEIAATLYLPSGSGPFPSVLMTHGWGENRQALSDLAGLYASNGFAALAYDSRGFGESGGLVTSTGPNEVGDARELITWLGDHDAVATDPTGDPLVGMDGASYGGGIQLRTAAVDDRLDAIVPRITWHDLPEAYAPDDVLKYAWAQALAIAGQSGDVHPEIQQLSDEALATRDVTEEFKEFYRSRSPVSYLHEVDTPALFVHSWYDRLFPPDHAIDNFRGLRKRGVDAGLVIQNGNGHHLGGMPQSNLYDQTQTELAYVANAALSWMGAYVAGQGSPQIPTVSLYDDTSGSFVPANSFPPADVGTRRYTADQPAVEIGDTADQTVATFDFAVDQRTEVLGTPALDAEVVPLGDGTVRLATALQHVTDDGVETINDQLTPVTVDSPTSLDLDMSPVYQVLEAGDALRLAVTTRDEAIDDVDIIPFLSDTGLFVDADAGTGAVLRGERGSGPTLSVPVRGA